MDKAKRTKGTTAARKPECLGKAPGGFPVHACATHRAHTSVRNVSCFFGVTVSAEGTTWVAAHESSLARALST